MARPIDPDTGEEIEPFKDAAVDGVESPIEQRLYYYMMSAIPLGNIHRQHWIGKYRVDFFVDPFFVIEADGEEFHSPEKDAQRDYDMVQMGYVPIRCAGSVIHSWPNHTVDRIKAIMDFYLKLKDPRPRMRPWRISHIDRSNEKYG
jgi:very-short-patch-repair endonuclease